MNFKKITAFLTAAALLSGGLTAAPAEKNFSSPSTVSAAEYSRDTEGFVRRMYEVVLGRNADSVGLNNWVTGLNSQQNKATDIVSGFFNSAEYKSKNKSAVDQVTDCYRAMLNREPDKTGLNSWVDTLNTGMTINAVLQGFVGSQEFKNLCAVYGIEPGVMKFSCYRDKNYYRTYFVYRLYDKFLLRKPDTNGLEDWCRQLDEGYTGSQLINGFIHSSEFKNRHYDNEQYITFLYTALLGRVPDRAGLDGWVYKLNYTDTREKVANGFIFSNEFKGYCNKANINVGTKLSERDNSQEWKYNIEILSLCNVERAKYGLEPLTTRQDFWEDVAMTRANEITKKFDHSRPNGNSWSSLYTEKGYHYSAAAENIAAGHDTSASVVLSPEGWMNSPGHRKNILSTNVKVLATGYAVVNDFYSKYYSQNFITIK